MPSEESTPCLRIRSADLDRLCRLADAAFPFEVCGLLVGREAVAPRRAAAGSRCVHEVTLARNLAGRAARRRFELDPEDFLTAERRARRSGLRILGVWHSHPGGSAEPSALDLDLAWKEHSLLIVAIDVLGRSEVRSWMLRHGAPVSQRIRC